MSSSSATATSQLSCFATIQYNNIKTQSLGGVRGRWANNNNRVHFTHRSHLIPSQLPTIINSDRHAIKASGSGSKLTVKYIAKASQSDNDILVKPNSSIEEYVNGKEIDQPERASKIHDFCFGIPYGAIVFSGGLIGFLFTRNPANLISGGLYGSALLALSMFSLTVWRQGQSSLPFILGQAGIAAALLWKNMKTYKLTKKILPTGLNVVISAAMLCFYVYVVVSGGNPPPKKLKSTAAAPS